MDKIQVGENVWIKPNRGCAVPKHDDVYWLVNKFGKVVDLQWSASTIGCALLNSGNFFPTREAAEAAIIKPADPTPITYEQWVEAGRPVVFNFSVYGELLDFCVAGANHVYFNTCKNWLTREAALAWLDKWNAEHGVKE